MTGASEHRNNFNMIRLLAAFQVLTVHALNHLGFEGPLVTAVKVVPGVPVVLVESAREFLHATVRQAWDILEGGGTPDQRCRARYRLGASHAAKASAQAVDILHNAAATTGILMKSPIERAFRDLHTADAHVMVSALTYEAAGRVELGMPANMPFF